jgi:hypothetical protein
MLSAFIENLEAGGTHVYSPGPFVLLCGGTRTDIDEPKPKSLRDAFLKSNFYSSIKNGDVKQIEDIREYFEKESPYKELVSFESNIAQLSDLVLLFSESPGSFAELGVFASHPEIAKKTLVVIQQKYLSKHSFISKGPIAYFTSISKKAVFSLTDASIGLRGNQYSTVIPANLLALLTEPVEQRLEDARESKTLKKSSFSHRCKLYVAFLREFHVLKDDELCQLFAAFDIKLNAPTLDRIAFCCKCVDWTGTTQLGFDRLHFALNAPKEAAKFSLSGEFSDRVKRRLEIRQFWAQNDPNRLEARHEAILA